MRLTQDDKMIHTLAPDGSDQSFDKAILPRRGRRAGLVPDAQEQYSLLNGTGNFCAGTGKFLRNNGEFDQGIVQD